MSDFIGREKELGDLQSLLRKKSASMVVVMGRRRIGKSRLLEEFSKYVKTTHIFSGIAPTKETTAQSQREEFASQFFNQFHVSVTNTLDWNSLFWDLAKQVKTGQTLVILDEITWMGSLDPDFLGKLKNIWDLYLKKNDHLILAICGSSSAWIDKNILSSTGFFGRTSLSLTVKELPLNDCVKFWNQESARTSAYDKFKLLSVTGGIPRYLEHIDPTLSAEDNIHNLCFNDTGILFNEFEKIFSDLFSPKNILYKNIVHCLVDGDLASQSTIAAKVSLQEGGDISEHLDNLIKSGFIARDYTWRLQTAKTSNLSHYRLQDNYSRFYLKYILPNRIKIEAGNMRNVSMASFPGWYSILGLQLENLVLNNRHLIKAALKIDPNDIVYDNPFFQRKTAKHAGCQIDYLIQTKYKTLYICEIKFTSDKIGTQIIEEIEEKIKRLSLPRYFSYRTVLIHVNGVSEALQDTQYFSHIIDITTFLSI